MLEARGAGLQLLMLPWQEAKASDPPLPTPPWVARLTHRPNAAEGKHGAARVAPVATLEAGGAPRLGSVGSQRRQQRRPQGPPAGRGRRPRRKEERQELLPLQAWAPVVRLGQARPRPEPHRSVRRRRPEGMSHCFSPPRTTRQLMTSQVLGSDSISLTRESAWRLLQ